MALEDHAVEGVADDKEGQWRCVGKPHALAQVGGYLAVGVYAHDHRRGQSGDGRLEVLLVLGIAGEEQHDGAAPCLELATPLGDVA